MSENITLDNVLNEVLESNLSNTAKIYIIKNLKESESYYLPTLSNSLESPIAGSVDNLPEFLRLKTVDELLKPPPL